MKRTYRSLIAATFAVAMVGAADHPSLNKSEEYLILGDANRGAGEPVITVNPKDPNNILIAAMGNLHRLPPDGALPDSSPKIRIQELITPDETLSMLAISQDGGRTWKFSTENLRDYYKRIRCPDPYAGAGPDGTMYWGCLPSISTRDWDSSKGGEPRRHGIVTILSSSDKGNTWSAPHEVMVQDNKESWAPGLKPVFEAASPYDRPYLKIDSSTGAMYVQGTGRGREPIRPQQYVTASHDHGKTWGTIYAFDSDEYPMMSGGLIDAGHGFLAVAYIAKTVPSGDKCPCAVLGLSRDDGKTFERHVIPGATISVQGGRGFARAMLAVDQSKAGRFAVVVPNAGDDQLMAYLTEDSGKNWSGPVVAAQTPNAKIQKPAIKYSPNGELAVMWRAVYPDHSYDVWSSLFRDGGLKFSTVRVSHAVSPPPPRDRGNFLSGDDLSSMDVDEQSVHIVWGDSRSGFLGSWYARVPLSAYEAQ